MSRDIAVPNLNIRSTATRVVPRTRTLNMVIVLFVFVPEIAKACGANLIDFVLLEVLLFPNSYPSTRVGQ